MIVLGIETSCDETGIGIVKDGKKVLANIVVSSLKIHSRYGVSFIFFLFELLEIVTATNILVGGSWIVYRCV